MGRLESALAIVGAVMAAAGCSSSSNVVSCTSVAADDAGVASTVCQEFSGLSEPDQASWGMSCVPDNGIPAAPIDASATFAHAPCSRAGAVGGCRQPGSGSITIWYYADGPNTAADISALCAQTGATFVAP